MMPEHDGGTDVDVIDQLEVILPGVSAMGATVRSEQFDNPTPCSDYRVRDLFDHMILGASTFAPQLRGESAEPVDVSTLADADRPRVLDDALADLLDATKAPGALGRTVHLPFGDVPGSVLAAFLTVDGMVHTWDMARATGVPYSPDDELAAQVLGTARQLIATEMRDGDTFGQEVTVAPDADPLTRLVAFTGRAV
jgi:uncharacterized protein (TIGR03086 family)